MQRMRAEWKHDGYCTRCGKEPATAAGTRCQACRGYDRRRFRNNTVDPGRTTAQTST